VQNHVNGIDAVSATDAWAAGYAIYPSAPTTRPLLARWNGTSWSLQATPAQSGDAFFDGVDGNSSTNVWAVGGSGTGTLTERWNGSAWSVVPSPNPTGSVGASLRAVKSLANDDAWAVGTSSHSTGIPTRTLIEHWNGTSWSILPSPSPDGTQNLLRAVDGVAANDVWAVGATGHDGYGGAPVASLVLHWNGSAWSQTTIPSSGGAFSITELTDVVAISANDVWAVGQGFSFTYFQQVPYLLHYNGTTWTHSTIPNPPLQRRHSVVGQQGVRDRRGQRPAHRAVERLGLEHRIRAWQWLPQPAGRLRHQHEHGVGRRNTSRRRLRIPHVRRYAPPTHDES
jgi:hypothetical protein